MAVSEYDYPQLLVRACRLLDRNNITITGPLGVYWTQQKPIEDSLTARKNQAQSLADSRVVSSLGREEIALLREFGFL